MAIGAPRHRFLQIQIWLLIPLSSLLIGLGTHWMTSLALNHPLPLQAQSASYAYPKTRIMLSPSITSIHIKVDLRDHQSEVKIYSIGSSLSAMEFAFPETDIAHIEAHLSQQFGIDIHQVEPFIQYSD